MPSIYTPKGVKVEMVYTLQGQRCENVYYVTNGAVATLANLQSLWTIFRDWEQNTARLDRSVHVQCVLIALTALDGPGAPYYENAVNPTIGGGINVASAPAFVSVAIKHTTGKAGRSFRGRSYWIGLITDWILGVQNIPAASANSLAGRYNTLRASLLAAGWQFCICSQYSGVQVVNGYRKAIPRASGILTPVTASTCETGIDTNRHRKIPYQV